jgi:hypothetical protein
MFGDKPSIWICKRCGRAPRRERGKEARDLAVQNGAPCDTRGDGKKPPLASVERLTAWAGSEINFAL